MLSPRCLRHLIWAAAFVSLTGCASSATAEPTRDVLGVAHTAGKYNFTDKDFLNEGADELLELGTRVIKVWFGADAATYYPFNSDWEPAAESLVEVAEKPYYRALFAKPFTTYLLVLTRSEGASYFWDGMTAEEVAAEKQQVYELARHLLTAYAGSGKTFVLQNWEGDHLLRRNLPPELEPDDKRLRGMADWWNARQDGVDQARKEVRVRGVQVLHAAEVNHLRQAMEGKVTATNDVIPFTHADLYSYSSWDVQFDRAVLTQALDYLERKAPDSRLFGRYNLYLGEFGAAKDHLDERQAKRELIRELADTALGWGVRYAIYWQVFCNEPAREYTGRPTNDDMRGFWLIRPDGTRSANWYDFLAFNATSLFRVSLKARSGRFVAAANGGGGALEASQGRLGPWGTFTIQDLSGGPLRSGDKVYLQAHNGFYLGETPEGGLAADRRAAGVEETFVVRRTGGAEGAVIRGGNPVVFEAPSGRLLTVADDGEVRVGGRRAGPDETFRVGFPDLVR